MIYAKVLAHTKNRTSGNELITVECGYHRFILPEVNTYRMLSKNSASSRGIPISKRIEKIKESLAYPVEWGRNQKGMVASEEVNKETQERAAKLWKEASEAAIHFAEELNKLNIHKQIVNRVLEPFSWQHSVITGMRSAFDHMFEQRIHKDAQPEFRELAIKIKEAIMNSIPKTGVIHFPYILPEEEELSPSLRAIISVARCARVSYTPFDSDKADIEEDVGLFGRLYYADPPHLSPFEHVAIVNEKEYGCQRSYFNLTGFVSFRWLIETYSTRQDFDYEHIFDNLEDGFNFNAEYIPEI
ncbi:MAG: FAD-dependent thymidylate synthase [Patescibacteria group bacterium]|nr:FAD-dependent thymidylate synthase [Patescibacteria group bacterium]